MAELVDAHTTRVLQARPKVKLYDGINTGSNPVCTTKKHKVPYNAQMFE